MLRISFMMTAVVEVLQRGDSSRPSADRGDSARAANRKGTLKAK
jgi:hypothetical protein